MRITIGWKIRQGIVHMLMKSDEEESVWLG